MPIMYHEEQRIFKLDAGSSSYVFWVSEEGYLLHLYYGAFISDADVSHLLTMRSRAAFSPNPASRKEHRYNIGELMEQYGCQKPEELLDKLGEDFFSYSFSLDTLPQEYSCNGTGDYRISALSILNNDGNQSTAVFYRSHKLYDGKPSLEGMPATYAQEPGEAQTLELETYDPATGAVVTLVYTAFSQENAIARSVRVENTGAAALELNRVHSCCVDFNRMDYDFVHLYGKWAKERMMVRRPLEHGLQGIASKRGASGHSHNPFAAVIGRNTTEDQGEAYGFSLVYSGNFSLEVEVDSYDSTRLLAGINPEGFGWVLEPGQSFQAPEVVMVYSNEGLGGMSRTFHRLYRERLCRGKWKAMRRPVLINSWEAAYFNFDDEKLVEFAKEASELGIDMLVMDDGWFGKRNDDSTSLGDWYVNTDKIKCGLPELVRRVNETGLEFGIWYEPEMISPDSDLYRAHPEWALAVPGRESSLGRNQLVLDMSRADVRDYLFTIMSEVLASANIVYVKWDFNRNLTEVGSALLPAARQREVSHRYVLGLYDLLERLNQAFPEILFEGCSGGGGRFDPAMLYYSPQIWASDDTDAFERVEIQYGTSMVYPISSIGAHVSACPNHQTGRTLPLKTRGTVALSGTFGYELDPCKLSLEEKAQVKEQIALYNQHWELVQKGELYRLVNPFENRYYSAWMIVSRDKREALVFYVVTHGKINAPCYIRLQGLDAAGAYSIDGKMVLHGDSLMNAGLNFSDCTKEGESKLLYLRRQ